MDMSWRLQSLWVQRRYPYWSMGSCIVDGRMYQVVEYVRFQFVLPANLVRMCWRVYIVAWWVDMCGVAKTLNICMFLLAWPEERCRDVVQELCHL